MKRESTNLDFKLLPEQLHKYFVNGAVFDCSCSKRAKTYYLSKTPGYYLKIGPKGSLRKQALLSDYFSEKGFGAPVLEYFNDGTVDYLFTVEIRGFDGCHDSILAQPERLCDVFSESLRMLHEADCTDCPIVGVTSSLIPEAHKKFQSGNFDAWMLEYANIHSPEEGYTFLCQNINVLQENTQIHGDSCLPNIIIDNWKFSGFIDFEGGGIGDRHFDLLWAIWSIGFNLKTEKYRERFLDGYGRDAFDMERFKLCTVIQSFTWED